MSPYANKGSHAQVCQYLSYIWSVYLDTYLTIASKNYQTEENIVFDIDGEQCLSIKTKIFGSGFGFVRVMLTDYGSDNYKEKYRIYAKYIKSWKNILLPIANKTKVIPSYFRFSNKYLPCPTCYSLFWYKLPCLNSGLHLVNP